MDIEGIESNIRAQKLIGDDGEHWTQASMGHNGLDEVIEEFLSEY